jgi:hypothetical protein
VPFQPQKPRAIRRAIMIAGAGAAATIAAAGYWLMTLLT